MLGAIILAVVIVIVIPVTVIMSGAAAAAVLGWRLKEDGEEQAEGSELVDLNV